MYVKSPTPHLHKLYPSLRRPQWASINHLQARAYASSCTALEPRLIDQAVALRMSDPFLLGTDWSLMGRYACHTAQHIHLCNHSQCSNDSLQARAYASSCAALETRLVGEAAALRKHDSFLLGADWSLVWRYVPAPSPGVYWTRAVSKRIVYDAEEGEDAKSAAN